ncbi:MAG: DUF86 domain-containing protein [Thermodesulfobacteriota bacterium]
MPSDYKLHLDAILEACCRVREYTDGISLEEVRDDSKTQDAIKRNLVVIGEAATRLPGDISGKYQGFEWSEIVALRNLVKHEYLRIKIETLWDVVKGTIPALEDQSRIILSKHT